MKYHLWDSEYTKDAEGSFFPNTGSASHRNFVLQIGSIAMRMQPVIFLFSVVTLSVSNLAIAQDPLDELYGQAVHSFFRGDVAHAEQLLNEVIAAGSLDPRALYFRGMCLSRTGQATAAADFERAAQMEIEGKRVVNVGKALERIQGPVRVEIEKARSKARLASRSRVLEMQRTRYEEMQRSGNALGGLIVPPRTVDPAPAPSAFAPNDPFITGLTKGAPKEMEGQPKTAAPSEAIGGQELDPLPKVPPTTVEPEVNPFGN
jgi:hypothetical protein